MVVKPGTDNEEPCGDTTRGQLAREFSGWLHIWVEGKDLQRQLVENLLSIPKTVPYPKPFLIAAGKNFLSSD